MALEAHTKPEQETGQFSVFQFFPNECYEEVLRFVSAETAMRQAVALICSVGGRLGTTQQVIITDAGDFTCFHWKHGQGVVFPVVKDAAESNAAKEPNHE